MTLDINIVQLESIHVASAYGFGDSPEAIVWKKVLDWADSKCIWDKIESTRFFGFNNPSPSPGSPSYGYEQWVTVPENSESEVEMTIKEFSGGLYAVLRCQGIANVGNYWEKLVNWRENSAYHSAAHQWLEEMISDPREMEDLEKIILDLYLPISE
ncbi:MAG: GyrI-like domain-containing protein [Anaerolineaceae bacterium]|nr:GyrI-like domain-containing protein [Anaerolineaceae bacterium]